MRWNRIKAFFSQRVISLGLRQKLGVGFFFIGFLFLGLFFLFKVYDSWQKRGLSFSEPPPSVEKQEEDPGKLPQKIIIPRLKIDLPIEETGILKGEWEVSATAASYLVQSALPGERGKVIIYGHNRNHLFGPLKWLKKGEEVLIENKKEETFIYEIIETKVVSPDQIEVLLPTEEPTLILYTCFGFLDSKRFVVIGKLKQGG